MCDLKPITNSKVKKRIEKNIEFAKTIIFINNKLDHNPATFTNKELYLLTGLDSGYSYKILEYLTIHNVVKKISGYKGVVYIGTDEAKKLYDLAYKKFKGGI